MSPHPKRDGPLREREEVQSALTRILQAAHEGEGNVVFVIGEAGLGKTRVMEQAAEEAAGTMAVGWAGGEEMERAFAFGLFGQLARSLGDQLDPGGVGAAPVVEPTAPYHRVLRWIERRSSQPMLLAFDDLHFADPDSLNLLSFLARRVRGLPVALIGTLRPWPPHAEAVCRQLAEAGNARIERLAPLGEASVSALLGEWTGEPVSRDVARRTWSLCNGNPLLVEQVALALRRGEGVPDVGAAATELGTHLLLARFAGVDAEGLRLARAGSVLGTSFRPGLASEVADVAEHTLDDTFESLFRGGLVEEAEDGALRFAHPLFGQALYEDMPASARQRLHARAFDALERRGFDAAASEHALRAHLVGDARAVASLERAGRAALAAGALASATRALEGAVQFGGDRPALDLALVYCEALTATGRLDEASRACRRLLAQRELRWEER